MNAAARVQHLQDAERLVRLLLEGNPRPDVRARGDAFIAGNRAHLAAAVRAAEQPIVFDVCTPGYVWLGPLAAPEPHTDPRLAGLQDAWTILLAGVNASASLSAQGFGCTGRQPGGALRARLRQAADWLDARCAEVGELLRAPHIVVGDDGTIVCTPPRRQVVLLLPPT